MPSLAGWVRWTIRCDGRSITSRSARTGDPLDRSTPVTLHFQPDLMVGRGDDDRGDRRRRRLSIAVRDGDEQRRADRPRSVATAGTGSRGCSAARTTAVDLDPAVAPEVRIVELPARPVRRLAEVRFGVLRGRVDGARPRHVLLPRQRVRTDRLRHVRPHGARAARGGVRIRRSARPRDRGTPARTSRRACRPELAGARSVVPWHGRRGRWPDGCRVGCAGIPDTESPATSSSSTRPIVAPRSSTAAIEIAEDGVLTPQIIGDGSSQRPLRPADGQARLALPGPVRPPRSGAACSVEDDPLAS